MASNRKYWKSLAELKPDNPLVEKLKNKEFTDPIPVEDFLGDGKTLESSETTRRDFLKYVGFSTAAASLAACEGPIIHSVPYVVQPEAIVPGVANYYATAIADGYDFANILVKTREGRPIKIENNGEAPFSGSANARVQASLLSLYDQRRLQGPLTRGTYTSWEDFDQQLKDQMQLALQAGKQIVLLTPTLASPSTDKLIQEFIQKYSTAKHVVYDTISDEAAVNVFEKKYGSRALPDYDLAKAEVIVSVGADFLGDWQGGGYAKGYASGRIPKDGKMSMHVQLEANMSISGAKADYRLALSPEKQKAAIAALHNVINGGVARGEVLSDSEKKAIEKAGRALSGASSKGILLCGLANEDAQSITLSINESLGSEVIDTSAPRLMRQGNLKELDQLQQDMVAGQVGVLIMSDVDPLYTLADAESFKKGMEQVGTTVSFSLKKDKTASACNFVGASSHYLESWGDVEMKKGFYSFIQPVIRPLFDSRQLQEALLNWNENEISWYEYLKQNWTTSQLDDKSWVKAIQDGVYPVLEKEKETTFSDAALADGTGDTSEAEVTETVAPIVIDQQAIAAALRIDNQDTRVQDSLATESSALQNLSQPTTGDKMQLVLYSKVGMGDGRQANNPWLQEFPDPITRVSWDNYFTIGISDAEKWGVNLPESRRHSDNGGLNGAYAKITTENGALTAPVIVQPGQAPGTVGLAFGYGKKEGIQKEMQTGQNAFKLYHGFNHAQEIKNIEPVSGLHKFACMQLHNTLMGRGEIIKETSLKNYKEQDAALWNKMPVVSLNHEEIPARKADLWQSFDTSIGHHFNLSIDLNACTGCGACVIACQVENNVPVVGKDEVRRSRDMHWLRIDRYYSSEDDFAKDEHKKDHNEENGYIGTLRELEEPAENPQVAFQPVMCQHCNHAPCETVCPVAATSHGRQGQNQMAYNRCVGTRYCANNCPYKVRRFNWFLYSQNSEFNYNMNNDLGRMVLNPDVTVRSRGVMEKCSFCIQKTQKTILDAKRDRREIKDGEFQTACSLACDTGAMVFGDANDKKSEIARLKTNSRAYHLLEAVGTQPNVFYQVQIRNTEES